MDIGLDSSKDIFECLKMLSSCQIDIKGDILEKEIPNLDDLSIYVVLLCRIMVLLILSFQPK